jgi:hypothetical protein
MALGDGPACQREGAGHEAIGAVAAGPVGQGVVQIGQADVFGASGCGLSDGCIGPAGFCRVWLVIE